MKTPITKQKIQNHFTYCWWKYMLLVVLAIFGWSIIYSITEYRPPEEKKIILGVYCYGSDANLNAYMETVRQDLMPDMEDMSAQFIMPDETHGDMILMTRIAARECDIYVLPRTKFQQYAEQAGFMPIDQVLPELVADLESAEISLSRGWRAAEEDTEKHLYGIPCADLPGLSPMIGADTSDMYLSIFYETGNNENVLRFFEQFVRDMMVEPTILTDEAAPAQ